MTRGTGEDPDLGILNPERNKGYLPKPIPHARDHEIESLLLRHLAGGSLVSFQRCVEDGHAKVLRAFAERMASTAVSKQLS